MSGETGDGPGARTGWLDSVAAILRLLGEAAQDRRELFTLELREISVRYAQLYVVVHIILFVFLLAFLCLNTLLLVTFWEQRVGVALGLVAFYGLTGLALGGYVLYVVRTAPAPFSATRDVLEKDREALLGPGRSAGRR